MLEEGIIYSDYKEKRAQLDKIAFDDEYNASKSEVEILRDLLLDENRYVRSQSASLLARFSHWPDSKLKKAFEVEKHRSTKITLFQTILELRGVPYHIALNEVEKIQKEDVDVNDSDLERIVQQNIPS